MNIKSEINEKSNEELIEILFFEKRNYNYALIQEVKRIVTDRGISEKEIQSIKKKIKNQKRKEYLKKRKEDTNYGFVELVLEILIQFLRFFD